MIISCRQCRKYRWLRWSSSFLILLLISIIPARLAIALSVAPFPQAILTLGGGIEREQFTAKFAKIYPELEIWVSRGIPSEKAHAIFEAAGISLNRVHLDRQAVDTVTNFTSLVQVFKTRKIRHLYLITSKFHMPRAKAIATLILGSQGIAFSPVSIPSKKTSESKFHILRDIGRALLWIISGRTGASFNPRLP